MSTILTVQGVIYVVTGLWPVISIGTFQKLTGPKTDLWLVKTVGLLLAVSGLFFIIFNKSFEMLMIAMAEAIVLIGIDVNYSIKKIISKIYLADAAMESFFVILYLINLMK